MAKADKTTIYKVCPLCKGTGKVTVCIGGEMVEEDCQDCVATGKLLWGTIE